MSRPPKNTYWRNAHLQLWNYNFYNTDKARSEPIWDEQRYYMQINGQKYTIRKSDDNYFIGGKYNGKECGLLQVIDDDVTGVKHGYLNSVRKGYNCTLTPMHGVSTRNIVLLAWKICYLIGLPYLELDDGSNYYCEDGYVYPLGDVHLLTDGTTWYESIIHVKPTSNPMYAYMRLSEKDWRDTQRRVKDLQWKQIESILHPSVIETVVPHIQGYTSGFAIPAFKQILRSPIGCWFFSFHTTRIFEAFRLISSKYFLWRTPPILTLQPASQYIKNAENFYVRHSATRTTAER